jgi:hypothetical protein
VFNISALSFVYKANAIMALNKGRKDGRGFCA